MSSLFGHRIVISVFGESHGPCVGVTLHDFPAGIEIDRDALKSFLARRSPGSHAWSSTRRESDEVEFLSGISVDGRRTTGAPLTAIIRNTDCRSEDYASLRTVCRPGHADYTAHLKYGDVVDMRGSGHFSGRLTAPLCIAGGLAKQVLGGHGIFVGAHVYAIAGIFDEPFNSVLADESVILGPGRKAFPVCVDEKGKEMQTAIENARLAGDSVGGIVEVAAIGVPGGIGAPMADRVEARIAEMLFGIPAIRGIEFGDGFQSTAWRGSQNNDEILPDGRMRTNHAGGMLGGITTGMPVIVRVAVKPTPSITMIQKSIDWQSGGAVEVSGTGRHDPCIVPRAVPVVEAVVACVLLDMICDRFYQK